MTKTGRNSLCPCGSGRKYKHCCLRAKSPAVRPHTAVPETMVAEVGKKLRRETVRRQQLGEVRPMIHANWKGKKWIAVGSELHCSDKWKTPIDFFFDYLKYKLTPEWGKNELTKPLPERHPVLQWYDRCCTLQAKQTPGPDGIDGVVPSGPMRAYILLSYDLYTLQHHDALQRTIIERLKHKDQFQGARHELFAAATCIRAGFKIEYENERDGSRRHTEFTAVHKQTGQRIAVEAKSRHRKGVLGQPGERTPDEDVRVRIRGLINDAIAKPADHPFIIFLDLNMPPASLPHMTQEWFEKIAGPVLADCDKKGDSDPWNLLLFSNFPDYYAEDDSPAPSGYVVGMFGKNPKIVPAHPKTLRYVFDAALKYGNIPARFEDLELS